MDKDYFLNSSIPPPPPPSLEFQHTMPTWNPLSSEQPMDCFMNPNWDQHNHHFDSALTSMVISSTSAASDTFALRELIGKLGTISNSTNVVPPPFPAVTTAATPSCFTVQINSPPKLSAPRMDQIVNNSTRNSQPLPALSSDPGFAERAAKFSCLGSRSFNGRTSQLGFNNGELSYRSSSSLGKFPRVGSSPALKQDGSPLENKNLGQPQMDIRPNSGLVSGFDKSLSRLSVSGANSNEESSVSEQVPSGGEAGSNVKTAPSELNSRKRKAISRGKAKEDAPNQAAETLKAAEADENANVKRSRPKTEGNGNENNGAKNEEMAKSNSNGGSGDENQKPPEPPKDYIHVRARRGQATDSHSLAERVRREKISERMKLLQDLVPGCNKVTGKALMLDEIINYVQALQRKVEFLSMKLASVNPRMDFDLDNLMSKDMFQLNASLPQPVYALDSSAVAMYGHQPQQTPQLHTNNTSSGSASQCQVDPLDASLCHNLGLQLPPLNGFGEGLPQFAALCEDDLQSIVQMGFSQNANADDLPYHSQGFPVADQASQMKVEL